LIEDKRFLLLLRVKPEATVNTKTTTYEVVCIPITPKGFHSAFSSANRTGKDVALMSHVSL